MICALKPWIIENPTRQIFIELICGATKPITRYSNHVQAYLDVFTDIIKLMLDILAELEVISHRLMQKFGTWDGWDTTST